MRIVTGSILLISFALVSSQASAQSGLATRVAELEAQVEALTNALEGAQEILQFVRIEGDPINGLAGPHWIIEGANVHVRSGAGGTGDGCNPRLPCTPTGLGNLIVGYNESARPAEPLEDRTGSHNLVVGDWHSYSSFAGFVVGIGNQVLARHASVCGGNENVASGTGTSVSGGRGNEAIGNFSSVSGGVFNTAVGFESSVSGGRANEAIGQRSSVSGGQSNRASGSHSSVSGGANNEASGGWASVSGGRNNAAGPLLVPTGSGNFTSVSGGANRTALNDFNWAAGSLLEPN